MKESTHREALIALSEKLEDLAELAGPISSGSLEIIEKFFLSGVAWGLDQQFRNRPKSEAAELFDRSIQDFKQAGYTVTEHTALALARFYHFGVQWGLDHQFLERKRIITPDLFH